MSVSNQPINNSTSTEGRNEATPNISSMIDGILANPELIANVASALGPMLKQQSTTETSVSDAEKNDGNDRSAAAPVSSISEISDKLPAFASALGPLLASVQKGDGISRQQSSHGSDRRSCLLIALKPYLCRERCEAIDYMIKLGKLSELFQALN